MSTPKDLIESSKSLGSPSRPASTEFPYAALNQGLSLVPAIEVKVETAKGGLFPFRMLPDSGASGTVLPRKYAVPLGFDLRECERISVDTGNGNAEHWKAPLPLVAWIAGRKLELRACFGNIGVAVLGREDFFNEFYVEINEPARVVIITPHDEMQPLDGG
jgi:Aspartyl protease